MCVYIELQIIWEDPTLRELWVGSLRKKKGGTRNSTDTQRIPRKCEALFTALTGNLWAAGSVTPASQGHGGLIAVEGRILPSSLALLQKHGVKGMPRQLLCR